MRAKNLKYLRKKYQEKQTELCKKFGVTQSTFSDFERGKRDIPDDIARNIAHHFRITLYEFTYFDLSTNDVVYSSENGFLPQKNNLFQILNAWFPVSSPPASCEDDFFVRGYRYICSLQARFDTVQNIGRNEIVDCLRLFQNSWECSKNEGALANCISTILFLCASYCGEVNEREQIFIQSFINEKKLDYLEAQKIVLRDEPDVKMQSARTQDRLAFVHEYEELLMAYIKQLKHSSNFEYRELADFYIACMYTVGFVDNYFDFETNHVMGINLMAQLYALDNQYAKRFFSPIMEIIDNSDI